MNFENAFMLPGLIIGLTLHEFGHAWSASLLGDDYARQQGRVSLNPLRHLTPLGTLALLLLPFGWGRPVPINLYNLRHPRRDYLLSSLAGPLVNLLVCAVCLGLMHLTCHPFRHEGWARPAIQVTHVLLMYSAIINAMLAVLNLLPIPPLDGSKIWPCILPNSKAGFQPKTNRFFMVVLLVLVFTNALNPILGGAMKHVVSWMPISDVVILYEARGNGSRALQANEWAKAEAAFTQVLAIDPRDDTALACRASARMAQKNWVGALSDIDQAIAINPLPDYVSLRDNILLWKKTLEQPQSQEPLR